MGGDAVKKESSDSDSDEPKKKAEKKQEPAPVMDEDLLGFGAPSGSTSSILTKPYNPTNITTPDFAAKWGEIANSKQFVLEKSPMTSPDLYKNSLESRLGFQVI